MRKLLERFTKMPVLKRAAFITAVLMAGWGLTITPSLIDALEVSTVVDDAERGVDFADDFIALSHDAYVLFVVIDAPEAGGWSREQVESAPVPPVTVRIRSVDGPTSHQWSVLPDSRWIGRDEYGDPEYQSANLECETRCFEGTCSAVWCFSKSRTDLDWLEHYEASVHVAPLPDFMQGSKFSAQVNDGSRELRAYLPLIALTQLVVFGIAAMAIALLGELLQRVRPTD
ncbi:hypothetical protein FIV42_28570 [Persicimonas caeni]|uniref:Uncharacterized protein n=1 Tax=Persicimonas caeni TaxID=2292766 RepID=A0A4Y6Q3I5_PERCE|nr:hypothetical protein [Persicimonas caeni]QDG54555.1 hypothetical protein FIV42_28570 [Persicimonas caeni]QED35776.1 hypothetical protein FRD00_28565 [Persicimonas caeni]